MEITHPLKKHLVVLVMLYPVLYGLCTLQHHNYVMCKDGRTVKAEVVETSITSSRHGYSHNLRVKYQLPETGEDIECRLYHLPDSIWVKYGVGDEIEILYHPSYPYNVAIPGSIEESYLMIPLILLFGTFALLMTFLAVAIIIGRLFSLAKKYGII